MPLLKSASPKALWKNYQREKEAGKRDDVAWAIAYRVQRDVKKKKR